MSADHERRVAEILAALADQTLPPPAQHELDQLSAATEDAGAFVRNFATIADALKINRWNHASASSTDDRANIGEAWARVILAIAGSRTCHHLRTGGPQPATARLMLHRIDCKRCLTTVRRPPAGEDDRCDWCGDRGVTTFSPVVMNVGPLVAMGDACSTCGLALRATAGEVAR